MISSLCRLKPFKLHQSCQSCAVSLPWGVEMAATFGWNPSPGGSAWRWSWPWFQWISNWIVKKGVSTGSGEAPKKFSPVPKNWKNPLMHLPYNQTMQLPPMPCSTPKGPPVAFPRLFSGACAEPTEGPSRLAISSVVQGQFKACMKASYCLSSEFSNFLDECYLFD